MIWEESSKVLLSPNQNNTLTEMLLDEIAQNRYRLQSILTLLNDAQDARDISNILEQLVREEMISHEKYQNLINLEELDLPSIVIKETKIWQDLKFLPGTIFPIGRICWHMKINSPKRIDIRLGRTPSTERNSSRTVCWSWYIVNNCFT